MSKKRISPKTILNLKDKSGLITKKSIFADNNK